MAPLAVENSWKAVPLITSHSSPTTARLSSTDSKGFVPKKIPCHRVTQTCFIYPKQPPTWFNILFQEVGFSLAAFDHLLLQSCESHEKPSWCSPGKRIDEQRTHGWSLQTQCPCCHEQSRSTVVNDVRGCLGGADRGDLMSIYDR